MSEDPYKILGVERNASQDDIKKAYRALSLKWHPDRNPGKADATAVYQSINAAYEILGDEGRRKEYDAPKPAPNPFGGGGVPFPFAHMAGGNPFAGMGMGNAHEEFVKIFSSGIFQQMHNGMQGGVPNGTTQIFTMGPNGPIRVQLGGQQQMKPPPIVKTVEIPIDKAYSGVSLPIEISRWVIEGGMKKEENETLYVPIPRGIDDGEIIILQEKGNANGDNNRGDVKIQIKVKNETDFKRDGLDLILHKTISLKEALCGFNFEMKFLEGRVFKIQNDNGNIIHPEYRKMIPTMGMVRDGQTGNLIIVFDVKFPENLSSEAIATISSVL
jgi:DnaJ family protein B protein 4